MYFLKYLKLNKIKLKFKLNYFLEFHFQMTHSNQPLPFAQGAHCAEEEVQIGTVEGLSFRELNDVSQEETMSDSNSGDLMLQELLTIAGELVHVVETT